MTHNILQPTHIGGFLDEKTYVFSFLIGSWPERDCHETWFVAGLLDYVCPFWKTNGHITTWPQSKTGISCENDSVEFPLNFLATKNSNLMTYKQICTSIFLNNHVSYFICMDLSTQSANRTFKPRIKPLKRQLGFRFFDSVPREKDISYSPSIISNGF